jgi:hypothetical protein
VFHYKTVFCPFEFFEHDTINECVYAHNWNDYRRPSTKYTYRPIECEAINKNSLVTGEFCHNGLGCIKSHNYYELEFHALNYKTKGCGLRNHCPFYSVIEEEGAKSEFWRKAKFDSKRLKMCPYYHSAKDNRNLDPRVLCG